MYSIDRFTAETPDGKSPCEEVEAEEEEILHSPLQGRRSGKIHRIPWISV